MPLYSTNVQSDAALYIKICISCTRFSACRYGSRFVCDWTPMNCLKLPKDAEPIVVATRNKTDFGAFYHRDPHRENHECGLFGCRQIGVYIPENLAEEYAKGLNK